MTERKATEGQGVIGTSQSPRTVHTLRLTQLMEEAQRLEIAERIRELREHSRFTQPNLAEKLGLTLRAYQKMEQRGTTKWERAEELAKIHGVTPEWIWAGEDRLPTPDLLSDLAPLARLEAKVDQILEHLEAAEIERAAERAEPRSGRDARRSSRKRRASDSR